MESIKKNLATLLFIVVLIIMLFLGDGKQSYVDVLAYGGIIAISLIETLWRKRSITGVGKEQGLWMLVLTYIIVRTLFSNAISYSIPSALRFVLAYVIYTLFSNLKISIRLYSSAVLFYAIVTMMLSAAVSLSPSLEQWLPNMNLLYRVYGHNTLAYLLLLSFPIAMRHFLKKSSGGMLCLLIAILFGIIITLARTVWFLVAVYLFYVVITTKISKKIKNLVWFILFTLTSVAIIFSFPTHIPGMRNFEQTIAQKGSVWESRGKYWKQALLSIKENPFVGTGPGTFYLQSLKYHGTRDSISLFAHSYPLQILSDIGVLGAVLLFLLYKKIFTNIQANKTGLMENYGLVESVSLSLLLSAVSINFDYLVLWMLQWATLGVLVSQTKRDKSRALYHGKSLYGIGLILLVIPYIFLVSREILQIMIGKERDVFTPYNTETSIKYIEKREGQLTYDQAQKILIFNREQPDVLSAIGTAFSHVDKPYSVTLYKHALINDPQNTLHFAGLMYVLAQQPALIAKVNPIDISDAFFYQIKKDRTTESVAKRVRENRFNPVYKASLEASLFQLITYKGSYFFPKFYYFLAVNLEQKDPQLAKELLQLSIDLAPQWSYFYLELAALSLKTDDKESANRILGLCQKQQYAREHCSTYTTETLEPVGYFQKTITAEL